MERRGGERTADRRRLPPRRTEVLPKVVKRQELVPIPEGEVSWVTRGPKIARWVAAWGSAQLPYDAPLGLVRDGE